MNVSTDWALLLTLNGWAEVPAGAALATALSSLWVPVIALMVLAVRSVWRRRPSLILAALLTFGVSDLVASRLLKPWVDRDRPCHVRADLLTPDGCGTGRSFPSGHATNAFSVAAASAVLWPASLWALGPLAFLVAGSRVVLGVHFPTDVAAGALLGACIGVAVGLGARRWEREVRTPSSTPAA